MAAKKKRKMSLKALQKMGRSNRNRGKVYERQVAEALKEIYPDARRLFGQSRKGADAPDVGGTPFWIEVGTGGTIQIRDKLNQALRDTAESEDPRWKDKPCIVFTRNKHNEHLVTMRRDQFLVLLSAVETAWKIVEGGSDERPDKASRRRKKAM